MTRKINILHVDDSKSIKLYIKIMLMEISSIQVLESAGNVAQAKTLLHSKTMDVSILDINLPDGDGISLLKWIKKYYPEMTVIMFSNSSDPFFRSAAQKAGADHFLDKSMEFEDLIKILKTLKLNHTSNYIPCHETNL
jgi:two-component system OmpR family response regulator